MGCKSLKFPTERLFAGGHRGVVTPVPIPNTEVKGSIAEGSAGLARARVGRRRLFLLLAEQKNAVGYAAPPLGRRFATRAARSGDTAFFYFTTRPLDADPGVFAFCDTGYGIRGAPRPRPGVLASRRPVRPLSDAIASAVGPPLPA